MANVHLHLERARNFDNRTANDHHVLDAILLHFHFTIAMQLETGGIKGEQTTVL